MKKSTKITLIVLGILIVLVGIVGITYAYFRTSGIQDNTNTFTSGCLSISLSYDGDAINIDNAYPVSDVEGLEEEGYSFTITNNCSTSTNYAINLESVNETADTLDADYIKVSLSSDTVGNVISLLSSNNTTTTEISGAYVSHNLYTGTLAGEESKNYTLKLWIDYDATVGEAANKTYQSKINVIANPETAVIDTLEATFALSDNTITANLTGGVTSANYCITTDNVCEPSDLATIDNDSYRVDLSSGNKMICTQLNETSKIICSEPISISAKDYILTYATMGSGTPNFANTSCTNGTNNSGNCGEETVGLYEQETSSGGTIYYFRGDVEDNYVLFAGYYWRIIRINEDGSIRLIYQGNSPTDTGQIGTSEFNAVDYGEQWSYYVGYTYTVDSQRPDSESTISDSTIKTTLENWYSGSNGISNYDSYITSEAGFCNDRNTSTEWEAEPSSYLYYAAYVRLITNKAPSLECNTEDLYKTKVGLITADEVAMAGGVFNTSNRSYYLYTGNTFWTMSPYYAYSSGYARVFAVYSSGNLINYYVSGAYGVRPVINLSVDATITGSGTIKFAENGGYEVYDPYVVQTT